MGLNDGFSGGLRMQTRELPIRNAYPYLPPNWSPFLAGTESYSARIAVHCSVRFTRRRPILPWAVGTMARYGDIRLGGAVLSPIISVPGWPAMRPQHSICLSNSRLALRA